MPEDILTLPLHAPPHDQLNRRVQPHRSSVAIRPLEAASQEALARLYLASYPPGVAADTVDEAVEEIASTFAGEFGALRADASATAWHHGVPVGAVMVVERSIWDEELEGPFIIELFVSPGARGLGAGRSLVSHAVDTCTRAGDPAISLRFGAGTSAPAMAIYRSAGFVPPGV